MAMLLFDKIKTTEGYRLLTTSFKLKYRLLASG
jgi:hypothetical protein